MPIYDHDGTVSHENGKVCDFDGAVSHQIGKVYDFDGTAGSLIYTAEQVLVGSGAEASGITNSANWTVTGDYLTECSTTQIKHTGGHGQADTFCKCNIPLPRGAKLTLTHAHTGSVGAVLIGTSVGAGDIYNSGTDGTHEVTIDQNTDYYITLKCWNTYSNYATVALTYLKIE